MRVEREVSDSFAVKVGVRLGCVMSPWLFNIFMDGCMREMKDNVRNKGAKLRLNGEDWSVATCLFVDDTMLMAESEEGLQRIGKKKLYNVCRKRNLKVNTGKNKVMVFERREDVIDFNVAYRVRMLAVARCTITFGRGKMEEVSEFKYLETVLWKHGNMEGETSGQVMKGRRVMGPPAGVVQGRNVSVGVEGSEE